MKLDAGALQNPAANCLKEFYKAFLQKQGHSSLTSSASTLESSIASKDLERFHFTGNCVSNTDTITGMNPTLFSLKEDRKVFISSCPFEAYVPPSFEEQLASNFKSFKEDRYTFCKSKLQEMVTALKSRKNRVTFHFHFGDCLELCLRKEEMKKKFQVIHSSSVIVARIGPANILSSCEGLLASPDAVLLTTNFLPYLQAALKLSVIEFIEASLCCPLSLIPTLYGMKLTNHLQLGSPFPVKLHEDVEKNIFITLKWQQSPGFSANIPLEISPVLETAIKRLAASRFANQPHLCCGRQLYTYYFILQSLWSRCALLTPAAIIHSEHFLAEVCPPLRLAWQTEQSWIKGEAVLRYSFSSSFRDWISKGHKKRATSHYQVMLISKRWLCGPKGRAEPSQQNWVTLYQRKIGNKIITCHLPLTLEDLADPSFSFLLVKNHEPDLMFCLYDQVDKGNPSLISLSELKSRVISYPTPYSIGSTLSQPAVAAVGLNVTKCSEATDSYEFDINANGVQLNDVKGKPTFSHNI